MDKEQHSETTLAYEHLVNAYPELRELFEGIGPLKMNTSRSECIEDAVVKITVGQMLSGRTADAIILRLLDERDRIGVKSCMELSDDFLGAAGVNSRKRKTIQSFRDYMLQSPGMVMRWSEMTYEELCDEIKGAIWGFSDWSVSMLAIFEFGNANVFPLYDGSINRAIHALNNRYYDTFDFDASRAEPFASYLALYLWRMLDEGRI